jgi:hypothetical protein
MASGEAGMPSGGGGMPSGEAGTTSGEGGMPSGEGGTTSGEGGMPSGEGGTTSSQGGTTGIAGEGGSNSAQGGSNAGESGSTSGQGGASESGAGGGPVGGEAGSGVRPCVVDLLPADAFAAAIWRESTSCFEWVSSGLCPTEFSPIIVDGVAQFSAWQRPGGATLSQRIATTVTIPSDAISVDVQWTGGLSCSLGNAFLGAQLGLLQTFPGTAPIADYAGQQLDFVISFSQTSGAPCSASLRNLSIKARRCEE